MDVRAQVSQLSEETREALARRIRSRLPGVDQPEADHDVSIVGGGVAALTLALQIRRARPTTRILIIEPNPHPIPEITHTVGESTVEVSAHYLRDQLGLGDHLQSDQLQARKVVADAMNSQRYLDLLATLQRWRTDPPLTSPPTLKALAKRARRAERKADRRLAEAISAGDDAMLHRARKAAKRARYAAELRVPVDKRAKETAKHYKQFQRVLGDHQDSVVATATLRRLAIAAGTTAGENGFTYGVLYAREQRAAEDARRRVRELIG